MRRRFLSWTWRIIILAVAVLLAVPNWLTLSVVAGNSKAAHAGERIFDVDAPGFRAATAIGAIGRGRGRAASWWGRACASRAGAVRSRTSRGSSASASRPNVSAKQAEREDEG